VIIRSRLFAGRLFRPPHGLLRADPRSTHRPGWRRERGERICLGTFRLPIRVSRFDSPQGVAMPASRCRRPRPTNSPP